MFDMICSWIVQQRKTVNPKSNTEKDNQKSGETEKEENSTEIEKEILKRNIFKK